MSRRRAARLSLLAALCFAGGSAWVPALLLGVTAMTAAWVRSA